MNGQRDARESRDRHVPEPVRPVLIGNVDGNRSPYHGVIGDIRIFHHALSETEVTNLFRENGWLKSSMGSSPRR